MTVESTTSRTSYTGDGGTGPFTVPFYFLSGDDLKVVKTTISDGTEETLVLTTDYTVSGAGDTSGGSITLTSALSSLYKVVIIREPDLLQETDYQDNDSFPANTHEQALDKLTMLAQRNKDLLSRSVRLSDGDTSGISTSISNLSSNKLIGVNSAGTALEAKAAADVGLTTVTTFAATLLDDSTAAAARATLGAAALGANTFTGTQTLSGAALDEAMSTVASATTPDIFAAAVGNVIDYTGTATATGFAAAPQAGARRTLVCAGAAVFTAGANMLIDGIASGSNFTAAAGDRVDVIAVTTTQFRLAPRKADGTAVALSAATQAEMEAATSTSVAVTPGRQQFHPSAAKVWIKADYSGGVPSITVSYGVSSITDTAVGRLTVTFTTAFSTANYASVVTVKFGASGVLARADVDPPSTTALVVGCTNEANSAEADPATFHVVVFGDQ